MEKHEEIKIIVGISLLYTIITSIFSLLSRFITVFLIQDGFKNAIVLFLKRNILWLIVVTGILVVLIVYTKKLNIKYNFDVFKNRIIRSIVGVLIALEGLINLSSSLPICIASVKSSIQVSQQVGKIMEGIITKSIISNVIILAIILCQVFIGVYLAKPYWKKTK